MNKILKNIVLRIQQQCNTYPKQAQSLETFSYKNNQLHPIFVIGAPRTGSTLLFQYLLKHGDSCYVSNLMALLPCYMLEVARWSRVKMQKKVQQIQKSDFGYIAGLHSPSEAGAIYRKWFKQPVTEEEARFIQNTIVLLSNHFNAPFVSKNLWNSLRLQQINYILPKARYIYLKRHPLYTAQSLILARRKLYQNNDNQWFSVKPKEYEMVLNKAPLYQVLWQVKVIEQEIDTFLLKRKPPHLVIEYENFCNNPKQTIHQIQKVFDWQATDVQIKPLKSSQRQKLSSQEWAALENYYQEIF